MATSVVAAPDDATQPIVVVPIPRLGEPAPWAGPQHTASPAPAGRTRSGPARRRAARGTVVRAGAFRSTVFGRPVFGSPVFRSAARSLFVTPWFAAATGFVIAAGLWVYSPHTVLRFPNSAPGVSACKSTGCVQESDPHGGSLAVAAPGVKISESMAARRAGGHVTHGLKFKFTVLWARQNGFGAVVTVSGREVPGSWRLSFDLPGAQIAYVAGVTWQANADGSGGTASALPGQPDWNAGSFGFRSGPEVGPDRVGAAPVISFLITASGPRTVPVHCVFDHATCRFR